MNQLTTRCAYVLFSVVLTVLAGCDPRQETPPPAQPASDANGPTDPSPDGTPAEPGDDQASDASQTEVEVPLTVPPVLLSGQHLETTLLTVGDTVPELSFTTLDGATTTLAELAGDDPARLVVLAFWQADEPYSEIQLKDLQEHFAASQSDQPLKIVSVNVGGKAEQAKAGLEAAGVTYTVVTDPKGENFLKFASNVIPRIYLLDGQDKIVWFDIGHTRDTRRHLRTAIDAKLAEKN